MYCRYHLYVACTKYFAFFVSTLVLVRPVLGAILERSWQLLLVLPAL